MPSSTKALPTKLAIVVTFHFARERLTYLRRISKEFTNLGNSVKSYIFTNDAKQHATVQRAIAWPGLDVEILSPTLLGHPYLLTWCHLSKAGELFEEDQSISHFLYLEADICFTQTNITWWLQAHHKLRNYGLFPGLLRYEVHPSTGVP